MRRIDHDTRVTLKALVARGQTRNEISSKTGAALDLIDEILPKKRGKAPRRARTHTRSQTPEPVPRTNPIDP